jgi:hypothetical protein
MADRWVPAWRGTGRHQSADGIEAVTVDGRRYAVGERALRLAHRRFVGLSRQWMDRAAERRRYFRYGQRLQRELGVMPDRVPV